MKVCFYYQYVSTRQIILKSNNSTKSYNQIIINILQFTCQLAVFANTPPSRKGRYRLVGAIEEEDMWR